MEQKPSNSLPELTQPSNTEKFMQFYRLHYPTKRQNDSPQPRKFRANSVMSVLQHQNPQEAPKEQLAKRKRSNLERIIRVDNSGQKQKREKPKFQPFSFKRVLSPKGERKGVQQYFLNYPPKYFGSVEEITRKNVNVRTAFQRCKDEKLKVTKVLSSQRQSEETKMDYLLLKRKQVQEQTNEQMNQIYNQFFKKQYEQLYGENAFSEFQSRMNIVVSMMHKQLFSS